MNKTAIQQAIEYLRRYNLLSAAIVLEDKYLPIEREQIEEAAVWGINCLDEHNEKQLASEYYTQTFKP